MSSWNLHVQILRSVNVTSGCVIHISAVKRMYMYGDVCEVGRYVQYMYLVVNHEACIFCMYTYTFIQDSPVSSEE